MEIDISNPRKYIDANNLSEVTSNNIFNRGTSEPEVDGLVSYEIFGDPSTAKRRTQFAYIDLGDFFINPIVFDTMCLMKKIIKKVVLGKGSFFIRNGNIFEVTKKNIPNKDEKIGSGVNWLKDNFKLINFEKDNSSATVKDRIQFLKLLEDDEIFIDSFIVIPAYYRDVDITNAKKNEINVMYQKIIAQASIVRSTKAMYEGTYTVTDSHRKVQEAICELYLYFTGFVAGTKAFMQIHALGKGIDYSARMVLSTPKLRCERPEDMEVDFHSSAVCLPMVLEIFAPFVYYGFKKFVNDRIQGSSFLYRKDKKGEISRVELAPHWEEILLQDNIHKLIKLYSDSKEHRLDMFTIEAMDGSRVPISYISTSEDKLLSGESIKNVDARPITLCEMFYMICMQTVIKDKPIMTTRYPVEDYHNIYPSFMNIIPYYKTINKTIEGINYPRFPLIAKEDFETIDIGKNFKDTISIFPSNLEALGADFDGDQVSIQSVMNKNNKCMDYIYSKTNIINIGGGTMRNTKDVTAHTIYNLTKGYDD